MEKKITVIKGDGIGPEIVTEAQKVLDKIAEKFGHKFVYTDILMGGCSIDKYGVPLTDEAVEVAKSSDAVLLGSIGGNTSTSPWYKLAPNLRPEAGLLKIRKELGLFANLRPANLYPELREACPLKDDIIGDGFDMMIMRELTGGLYFGARKTENVDGVETAVDTLTYNENEIRRIAIRGFDIAMKRRKKVTSVDKANVLDSSRLWRKVVNEVAKDYPEVELEHMLVDNCAMQLVRDPKQFDVILTENMFGDILSDEAAMISGSLGMLASASLNDTKFGMYEPSHGSAPDIAGQDKANPIATILSASMLLRFSFDMDKEADAIDNAVKKVLEAGYRTGDIMSEDMKLVGCKEMGSIVAGKDIKCVGIHHNRSLAVFQLFQQGSFRFLVSSQSRADADCLIVVRVGRYGKTGFVDVGFYDCFGYGGLQDVVVAHWRMDSQQPYSRTEAGAGSENRGSCHSF